MASPPSASSLATLGSMADMGSATLLKRSTTSPRLFTRNLCRGAREWRRNFDGGRRGGRRVVHSGESKRVQPALSFPPLCLTAQ